MCDKGYSSKRSLILHINTIHFQLKPFECDLCDKKYAQKASLMLHKKRMHLKQTKSEPIKEN